MKLLSFFAAISVFTWIEPARAQNSNVAPGFDPHLFEKQPTSSRPEAPRMPRSPIVVPNAAGPATHKLTPLFKLAGVSIEGARTIPVEELDKVSLPYIGQAVSDKDLAAMADGISDVYRKAGFHLTRAIIPAQDIKAGCVTVKVIEGRIQQVVVNGPDPDRFGIAKLLSPIEVEQPARLSTLERQLMLANDRPGVKISDTTLDEIGEATGDFRLVVYVKTWDVYASLTADNLGSTAVGPWQSFASAAYNSLLLPGDTLAFRLTTAPVDPREILFGRLSYDLPVGTDGFSLGGSLVYGEVRPGDYRRNLNTVNQTEAVELRGSIMPLRSQASSLTITTTLGMSNITESDAIGLVYKDKIRTAGLSVDYFVRDGLGGSNYFTVNGRQGLNAFGASRPGDNFLSRYDASNDSSSVSVWFTRYQTLNDVWSLKLSTAAQMSSAPLLVSQQFYLGGANFARGYGNAEISGDNGLAGSAELRFDQPVTSDILRRYQLYGFVDSGAVWNYGFAIKDGLSLTSAGVGVRAFLWDDFQAGLAVAFPLTYHALDNSNRSARVLFSLSNSLRLCPSRNSSHCG